MPRRPPQTLSPPPLRPTDDGLVAAHTTADAASVARWLGRHHGLAVQHCHLIRRGLNDNYAVRDADGGRWVARVYAIRPRGAFNVDFEAALLSHLRACGVGVAAARPAGNGASHVCLQFPEGPRALALFEHAEGVVPDQAEDLHLTGATLARVHHAAADYAGPPGRYVLDGHHLAVRALECLRAYPELDVAVLRSYEALVDRLLGELAAVQHQLTRGICHGDTHGFNNHVDTDGAGQRRTRFFDFDDAGPGFLAYDLCVFAWSHLYRKGLRAVDEVLGQRWGHYLSGYRDGGGRLRDADWAALPLFLQLRHLWNLGEGVGRVHHWGAHVMPADWLVRQLDVMEAWRRLELRAP